MSKKKLNYEGLIEELIDKNKELEVKNGTLSVCCGAYAKELNIAMNFIKSSEMRYQEFCKYQMECFKAEGHEVEA